MEINNEIERVEVILNHLKNPILPRYKEKVELYEWVLVTLKRINKD